MEFFTVLYPGYSHPTHTNTHNPNEKRTDNIKEGRDAADDLVSYHPHCHRHHQSLLRVFYSLSDDGACLKCFTVTYLFYSEGLKPQYIPIYYINTLSVVLQQFTFYFLFYFFFFWGGGGATRSLLCNYYRFSCFKGPAYAALIIAKQVHVAGAEHCIHVPSSVAQFVECLLREREAPGFIPGRGTPKSLLMLLVAPCLALSFSG